MAQLLVSEKTVTPTQENGQNVEFTKNVALSFIELYLMEELKNEGTISTRSPDAAGGKVKTLVKDSTQEIVNITQDAIAFEVANRLKIIGDQIDARLRSEVDMALKDLYASQSIWEVGYTQFRGTLQGLLSRCQGAVRSGWEQVSVVYTVTSRLVGELRVQQDEVGGMRETQMQGFANTYLRDSGIQQWVDAQGGMTHASIGHSPSGAQLVDISDID